MIYLPLGNPSTSKNTGTDTREGGSFSLRANCWSWMIPIGDSRPPFNKQAICFRTEVEIQFLGLLDARAHRASKGLHTQRATRVFVPQTSKSPIADTLSPLSPALCCCSWDRHGSSPHAWNVGNYSRLEPTLSIYFHSLSSGALLCVQLAGDSSLMSHSWQPSPCLSNSDISPKAVRDSVLPT